MEPKDNFVKRGYAFARVPYGANRRESREAFLRIRGEIVYDSDYSSYTKPTTEDICALLEKMPDGQALVVFGSNAWSTENELVVAVVFSLEGWKQLTGPIHVFPKVIKTMPWPVARSLMTL